MPTYSMGEYFDLSMYIVLISCLIPFLMPCGLPLMIYHDCRNSKYSKNRQLFFDINCIICFIFASLGCSWTIYEYYHKPNNRCSSNSDLFGISINNDDSRSVTSGNVWIMSQTTYCSFFALILLCSMTVCGTITVCLQIISKKKKIKIKLLYKMMYNQ